MLDYQVPVAHLKTESLQATQDMAQHLYLIECWSTKQEMTTKTL